MKARVFWVTALQMIIAFGMLLTGACIPQSPTVLNYDSTGNRDSRSSRGGDREPRDRETDNRERTGECTEDEDCQKICKDVFKSRKDRDECEEFSIADVERMEDVFEVLDDPDTDDLEDMNLSDLEFMLDISIKPLENAVDDMSPSEKKDFKSWLAADSEATDIIADSEDEFEILKELFGSSKSDFLQELDRAIDSGDSFVEVALGEGNDVALEWLHDFFGENCESKDKYEKCIFKDYYCELTLNGSDDPEEEYFDYEFFEDMLDTVLDAEQDEAHTADTWGAGIGDWPSRTEAGDLDKWKSSPHDVCDLVDTNYDDN